MKLKFPFNYQWKWEEIRRLAVGMFNEENILN